MGANWIVSYKVHVLKDGRWSTDHAGSDGDAARRHMHEVVKRGGIDGVRMLRDLYDPCSATSVTHIQHEQHFGYAGQIRPGHSRL